MRVRLVGGVVVAAALVVASCSGGSDEAATDSGPVTAAPTTLEAIFTSDEPTSEAGPVATTVVPPSTDLIGDPQPGPSTTRAPSPTIEPEPGAPPPPDACMRLDAFGVSDLVAERAAVDSVDVQVLSSGVCRYVAGDFVAEVHIVPLGDVVEDWFAREGIAPVGPRLGGEAVGLASFVTPTGETGNGYTIATVGNTDGVVVAVAGPDGAESLAADIAVFAQQAA